MLFEYEYEYEYEHDNDCDCNSLAQYKLLRVINTDLFFVFCFVMSSLIKLLKLNLYYRITRKKS
jgi:hypothetical protein